MQLSAVVQSYEIDMKRRKITAEEVMQLEPKRDAAEQKREEWEVRARSYEDLVATVEAQVKDICAKTEQELLAAAFADDADQRGQEIWGMLQLNSAGATEKDARIHFRIADPKAATSFQGLDRSTIPATPDILIKEGTGLQSFLKAAKSSGRKPSEAVGSVRGVPSAMSHARALVLFGDLEPPGADPPEQAESVEGQDLENVVAGMAQVDIAGSTDSPAPSTEAEFRHKNGQPTFTALTPEEQWKLLGPGKYISYVSILARCYVNLVKEKKTREMKMAERQRWAETRRLAGQDEESIAAVLARPMETAPQSAWGDVGESDLAGFTNWIQSCQTAYPDFGRTFTKAWHTERSARIITLEKALKSWTPPTGFTDGISRKPQARQFYKGTKSIADLDKAEMPNK
ncbi:hypothetical protein LTR17_027085 [Elasticomyces elasticus]|nr:hypothetical protein LTR17_027085 [Elasticomyces elasticus]